MQPISQQLQPEENYRLLLEEAKTHHRSYLHMLTIHQIDCTYYGEINKSYQKQGFGILQSINFQTYVGFWKNNKIEGVGLIVFPGGQIIYGQFSRNTLNGICIVDDGRYLRLAIFQGLDLMGVGFEYTYSSTKWRMIKYVKGVPVEQLREEVLPLQEGIPEMIFAQHSLYQFLDSYLKQQFFVYEEPKLKKAKSDGDSKYKELNEIALNKKQNLIAIGMRDQGGLHGIGIILNFKEKFILQSGFYSGNQLNGYCMQNRSGKMKLIGPFFKGLKHGTFIRKSFTKIDTIQFKEDKDIGPSSITDDQISKRQKSYNYEQKDFLSAKNSLDFAFLFHIFIPPETRNSSSRKRHQKQNQNDRRKQFERSPNLSEKKKKILSKEKISHTYLDPAQQQIQKSCVSIIKQKLRRYSVIGSERNARFSSEQKRRQMLNSNLNIFSDQEESIAIEENPFNSVVLGINLINQSPQRKH